MVALVPDSFLYHFRKDQKRMIYDLSQDVVVGFEESGGEAPSSLITVQHTISRKDLLSSMRLLPPSSQVRARSS